MTVYLSSMAGVCVTELEVQGKGERVRERSVTKREVEHQIFYLLRPEIAFPQQRPRISLK